MKKFAFLLCIILILFGSYTWVYSSQSHTREIILTALGDSITHGSGDPTKKGYIERVKVEFEKQMGIPLNVNNLGVPKYTTEDILRQLEDREVQKKIKKADYITLYIGTNDFRKSANYQFNNPNIMKINEGKLKFSENIKDILNNIRSKNAKAPILMLGLYQPYVEYENHQELLSFIEEWNSEIIHVIGSYDKGSYVPTLDLFKNESKNKYFSDSLHPNPAGYKLIADRLLKQMYLLEGNRRANN